jgi:hypothetical protein
MLARMLVSLGVGLAAFHGETSQHRAASVLVGADGNVLRIRIGYSAPCRDPRYRFPNVFRFEPPFEAGTPTDVADTVKVSTRLRGGGRNRQTASVAAHFDGKAWSGTFKTRAILTRHGKRLDKCELNRVSWTATPGS